MGHPNWAQFTGSDTWYGRKIKPNLNWLKTICIPEEYIVKHRILLGLYSMHTTGIGLGTTQEFQTIHATEDQLTSWGITIEQIRHYYRGLIHTDEIQVVSFDPILTFALKGKGIISVTGEHYLHNGRKEFWERLYTPSQVLAIVIAFITLILTIWELSNNKSERIQQIETELEQIKIEQTYLELYQEQIGESVTDLEVYSQKTPAVDSVLYKKIEILSKKVQIHISDTSVHRQ